MQQWKEVIIHHPQSKQKQISLQLPNHPDCAESTQAQEQQQRVRRGGTKDVRSHYSHMNHCLYRRSHSYFPLCLPPMRWWTVNTEPFTKTKQSGSQPIGAILYLSCCSHITQNTPDSGLSWQFNIIFSTGRSSATRGRTDNGTTWILSP